MFANIEEAADALAYRLERMESALSDLEEADAEGWIIYDVKESIKAIQDELNELEGEIERRETADRNRAYRRDCF